MNSRLKLNTFNIPLLVQSLFALLLAAPGMAAASATDIKDTNYPIPSGAYFVSPNGLDTNSGSDPASPWSVAKALTSAPAGATIVFRGGTYRDINYKIRKKLTLQPYPHEKAWIKGSVVATNWVADGPIWRRKDGWIHSFPNNVSSQYIDPNYPMAGYRDMVYINGVSIKQVASKASVVSGTFYVDSVNKQLYIGDNPTGKTVEATVLKQAFDLWKGDSSDPSDTVVRGLGFAHYADRAIGLSVPRVTFENNTFVWNGVEGVQFWGESGTTLGVSTDAIVRGNTFSYNGRKGLAGNRAHRMLLEDNTISYNNYERFDQRWDAAGVKVGRTDGLIWRNNLVEYNNAVGMWADISSSNATIVRNTVRNNERYGIFFEVSHKALIGANVVYNNNAGIMASNSSSVRVYNNTLAWNHRNLNINDSNRNNTNTSEIAAGITWIARNNVVINNIFSNASNASEGLLFKGANCGSDDTKEPSSMMFNVIDYNGYYRTSSSMPPETHLWSLGTTGKCTSYASVAAWKAATGYDSHGLAIDNVAINPFFVDEANRDFRLKTGSPAIGRGKPLMVDSASAIGVPPGVPVDLGALQATVY